MVRILCYNFPRRSMRALSVPTDGRVACLMKNFLRALRFVWPYRRRLGISIICVLIADKTPQTWVDERVETIRKEVKKLESDVKEQADREVRIAKIADPREQA